MHKLYEANIDLWNKLQDNVELKDIGMMIQTMEQKNETICSYLISLLMEKCSVAIEKSAELGRKINKLRVEQQ